MPIGPRWITNAWMLAKVITLTLKRMEFVNNASFMVFIVFFNGKISKRKEVYVYKKITNPPSCFSLTLPCGLSHPHCGGGVQIPWLASLHDSDWSIAARPHSHKRRPGDGRL